MSDAREAPRRRLPGDLRWGVVVGLVAASLVSLLVVFFRSTGNPPPDAPPLVNVVAAYVTGGVVGGAALGMLRPFTRRFAVRWLLAFIALAAVLATYDLVTVGTVESIVELLVYSGAMSLVHALAMSASRFR